MFLPLKYTKNFFIKLRGRRYLRLRKTILNLSKFHSDSKFNIIKLDTQINSSKFECALRLNTSDLKVFNQVFKDNEYSNLIVLVKKHISHNTVKLIVDAGANIGLTSLFLTAHFPDANIVAIEADSTNSRILKENIKINKLSKKISILPKALWINSKDKLYISDSFRDGDKWAKSVSLKQNINRRVSGITLSDIIKNSDVTKVIDILKLDIEGSEVILFNNSDFLNILRHNVRFLAVEIHEEVAGSEIVIEKLNELNFFSYTFQETTFAYNSFIN